MIKGKPKKIRESRKNKRKYKKKRGKLKVYKTIFDSMPHGKLKNN